MKSKKTILIETLTHIHTRGRAIAEDGQSCLYRTEDGNGCAVGRCIADEHYTSCFEGNSVDNMVRRCGITSIDEILMDEYRGHSIHFWADIQSIHDDDDHWNAGGKLTSRGLIDIEELITEHNIEGSAETIIPSYMMP